MFLIFLYSFIENLRVIWVILLSFLLNFSIPYYWVLLLSTFWPSWRMNSLKLSKLKLLNRKISFLGCRSRFFFYIITSFFCKKFYNRFVRNSILYKIQTCDWNFLLKKYFYPNFCWLYSAPMSTSVFARSDWSIFVIFMFLILLAPLLYKFGNSFNAILLSSCIIGALTTFLASFKILLPIPRPHWTQHLSHNAVLCL